MPGGSSFRSSPLARQTFRLPELQPRMNRVGSLSPVTDASLNRRTAILACAYTAVICASLYLAYEIRFDFVVPPEYQQERLRLLALAVGIKLIALIVGRQLGSLLTYFSIPDLIRLFWAMAGSSLLMFLPRVFGSANYAAPRGVLLTDFLLCFGALCSGRILMRVYRERLSGARRNPGIQPQQQRIAIVGAGDAGASLAKDFINSPWRGFRPVMFFDDDPEKHGKLIHGIPVAGRPEALAQLSDTNTLAKAVIAMPSASAKRLREVITLFTHHGLKVETLPSMEELTSGRVKATRIRPVEVQDLLGREAVDLDSTKIRGMIEDRCVMVTGAGGSIGGELCRQIAALNPTRLLMVEQAEGALFIIEQELNDLGLGGKAVPLVGDILDRERMEFIFSRYQPDVVFHAAAHKHVFMMERQPAEAIRNNVLGTRQLAQIAAAHGIDAFVLISTDKAINPTSVMGATKRLAELQLQAIAAGGGEGQNAEKLKAETLKWADARHENAETLKAEMLKLEPKRMGFQVAEVSKAETLKEETLKAEMLKSADSRIASHAVTEGKPTVESLAAVKRRANQPPTKFMAVRFGNVLGSSGSVIPIFKRQIANGGPVTVTHPDVTRYFMTIPEAVGLVLQSFVQGKGGEIFVLDMGQPVKIVDLAKQMIELSGFRLGDDIEIKFTGLKPGEKLFEELQHHTESHEPTEHPRIMRFVTNSMFSESGVRELEEQLYAMDSNELKAVLRKLVPEYTPFLD
jgi:FlaA1/EpsC-like NDP-sugar epimerase